MLDENYSYIFGLFITDGNLNLYSRNRGKVTLEVSQKDENIINKLINIIPNSKIYRRTRSTNFKKDYKTISFRNNRKEFRDFLINSGFPTKDKTNLASIPSVDFIESDFWRGVIDGDGSLGITSNNEPFISLVTKSEELKNQYLKLLKDKFNITKKLNRNKRDDVYNIVVKNETAIELAKYLYFNNNISLYIDQKYNIVKTLLKWKRTKNKDLLISNKMNHFIEYNEQKDGDLSGVTLHFGSRNFGVKVCKYWMNKANKPISKDEQRAITAKFKEDFLNAGNDRRGLGEALKKHLEECQSKYITGYLSGDLMKGYLCDMCFAQLYAQFNHITVQKTIKNILSKYGIKEVKTITSTHNFIDLEDHVLRKSAIRSYAGETILVPFNMRDGVAICEGLSNSNWLNSCAHGAGRRMSRSKAKENISLEEFKESMKDVYSTTVCTGTIDESPMAYKETNEIQDLIKETCEIKFMMIPKINIKAADGGE